MRAGSWGAIGLICFYCVLAGSSLGKVIPLIGDITAALGISPLQASWVISVMALVSAILAPLGGWLADRFGDRLLLVAGTVLGLAGNAIDFASASYGGLIAGRFVEGIAYIALMTGTTTMMMRTVAGSRQAAAMALVGTSVPLGVGLGEAIGGAIGGGAWHRVFLAHGALLAIGLVLVGLLPAWRRAAAPGHHGAGPFAVYRESGPMRLALSIGLVVFVQFGVGALFPNFLRAAYGLPIAKAAGIGGLVMLSGILGSVLAGLLLSLRVRVALLALGCFGMTGLAGIFIYWGGLGLGLSIAACLILTIAGGFGNGLGLALLPVIAPDPARRGAASGIMNQMLNIGILFGPPVCFAVYGGAQGKGMLVLIGVAACLGYLLLPRGRALALAPAE